MNIVNRTVKGVHQALIDQFSKRQGSQLVKGFRYVLQDSATKKDLSFNIPFSQLVQPKQKLVMSIIFFLPREEIENSESCPRCKTLTSSNGDADIKWSVLLFQF